MTAGETSCFFAVFFVLPEDFIKSVLSEIEPKMGCIISRIFSFLCRLTKFAKNETICKISFPQGQFCRILQKIVKIWCPNLRPLGTSCVAFVFRGSEERFSTVCGKVLWKTKPAGKIFISFTIREKRRNFLFLKKISKKGLTRNFRFPRRKPRR